jgi:SNF2 family DNA or RNA helicase
MSCIISLSSTSKLFDTPSSSKWFSDLQTYLRANSVECELLHGATPADSREEIIKQFHQPNCVYKVIIANPSAVGESISLHKACHNAIYLEKNFNAAMYMQSKDRVHRYGLDDNDVINYYYLISENSIDQTIHDRWS